MTQFIGAGARLAILSFVAFFLFLRPNDGAAEALCKEAGDTAVIALPDPVSGRKYEIYVSLPPDYAANPAGTYPLVMLADGGRAFPRLSCAAREKAARSGIAQSIIVGLSYAAGEPLEDSRRRDYTPVALKGSGKLYGGASAYQTYLRDVVLPHVEHNYRIRRNERVFWGHSYGGLLGAHILLTEPSLFQKYILGSPSFWFGNGAIHEVEARYAAAHRRIDAELFLYVGGLETARYDPARKGNTRDMVAGMRAFEARLQQRRYAGLKIASATMPGKDHRSAVGPGFSWGIDRALGLRNR